MTKGHHRKVFRLRSALVARGVPEARGNRPGVWVFQPDSTAYLAYRLQGADVHQEDEYRAILRAEAAKLGFYPDDYGMPGQGILIPEGD